MKAVQDDAQLYTWKIYVWAAVQFLFVFYLATFAVGYCFINRGEHWQLPALVIGGIYLLLVLGSAVRMVRKLSMTAVMIASPTIPLLMMIAVVSLLPILQALDKRPNVHLDEHSAALH